MSNGSKKRKAAFDRLLQAFKDEVIPVLEDAEFQPSVFSSHHFGADGRDFVFTFASLHPHSPSS